MFCIDFMGCAGILPA